jgi:hypothetical protein
MTDAEALELAREIAISVCASSKGAEALYRDGSYDRTPAVQAALTALTRRTVRNALAQQEKM